MDLLNFSQGIGEGPEETYLLFTLLVRNSDTAVYTVDLRISDVISLGK